MSRTLKAQREANEANIQMNEATNTTNRDIADAQNELNYKMFNEQNAWNREQWNLENEYNSPSQQMQRYLEAGVNPLWAISNGDPGNAQSLRSAQAQPAAGATFVPGHVDPVFDPNVAGKADAIVGAATNIVNGAQGFMKLGLEGRDVDIRQFMAQSQHGVNMADLAYKKAQTAGQDIFNNLNTKTFDTLVGIKVQEYDNLVKQGSKTAAEIANLDETKKQIVAMTNYTNQQANSLIQQVAQGWRRLAIDQQNANTSEYAAYSSSYYQGENLKLAGKQFDLDYNKFIRDSNNMTNDQIIKVVENQRSELEKRIGFTFGSTDEITGSILGRIQAAGKILSDRVKSNPSQSNLTSYQEYLDNVNRLPSAPSSVPSGNSQGFSVLNPSAPWNQ